MARAPSRPSLFAAAAGAVLALAVVALYAPGLGRGFVSEDFLILRRLHDGGWRLALEQFTGPWLGVTFVGFYRPLASALLDAQLAVFGVRPAPLLWVQLLLHLLNTALVGRLAWCLVGRDTPLAPPLASPLGPPLAVAAAALFALHPLHPNAVLFVASFATLYATAGVLAAALLHLRGRRSAALGALGAAFLCYEQAAVGPALLLALDLALPTIGSDRSAGPSTDRRVDQSRTRRIRELVRRHAPYWLALGVYLVGRRLALGASVGGYDGFRTRLAPQRWPDLLRDLGHDLVLTVSPRVVPTVPTGLWIGALGIVAATLVAGAVVIVRGRDAPNLRLASLGLAWTILALAPFAFAGIVPGNGRYLYLSVAGSALAVVALGRALVRRLPHRQLAILLPATLSLLFAAALLPLVRLHVDASDTAARVQAALLDAPPGVVLVADRPNFLQLRGRNAAQVVHWGLADAVRAPFVEPSRARTVVPLPDALGDASLAHLARQLPTVRIMRWTGDELAPFDANQPTRPDVPGLNGIPSRLLADASKDDAPAIAYRGNPARRHRLVLLTAGAPDITAAPPPPTSGFVDVPIPARWLESMRRLYPDTPAWAWIEALDRDGHVVAASAVHAVG